MNETKVRVDFNYQDSTNRLKAEIMKAVDFSIERITTPYSISFRTTSKVDDKYIKDMKEFIIKKMKEEYDWDIFDITVTV